MPSVPDPKASFPGLFDAHRGDFQVTPVPVLPRHALLAPPPPPVSRLLGLNTAASP